MTNQHPPSGRILAIDLGEKRIGVALSDPQQKLARSYCVLKRRSRREDFQRLGRIIAEQEVVLVVMGLPIRLDGSESSMTRWVRHYSAELVENLTVPLVYWDESYTTQQAHELLQERGVTQWQKRKEQVDAVAAAFILQGYLDAQQKEYDESGAA
ncbi:MAG: Holliday junction resolvase RuvX [Anaerolineales bacterium]|nr:Holliday junction resolvase RuvX [Anaerolineales bacterium]